MEWTFIARSSREINFAGTSGPRWWILDFEIRLALVKIQRILSLKNLLAAFRENIRDESWSFADPFWSKRQSCSIRDGKIRIWRFASRRQILLILDINNDPPLYRISYKLTMILVIETYAIYIIFFIFYIIYIFFSKIIFL